MDRELLESCLSSGMSLERIGRKVGKHPTTVGYWLAKYGLEAVNRERHASRGSIPEAELRRLVTDGLSIRAIAARLGVSYTTVRHWVIRYGLQSRRSERAEAVRSARAAGLTRLELVCPKHGRCEFVLEGRRYFRCGRCRVDYVSTRRRRVKAQLVVEAGGRCAVCGYDRHVGALQFHHLEPSEKSFTISHGGIARALEKARVEASKCILLCANCHAEVESGTVSLL
jgi:transposase